MNSFAGPPMTNDQDPFTRDGFVKGYTEAMLKSLPDFCPHCGGRGELGGWSGGVASIDGGGGYESEPCECVGLGPADLPEDTKAAILKDCAEAASILGRDHLSSDGEWFWNGGQRQPGFRPLTPSLDDKGKVRLSLKETR